MILSTLAYTLWQAWPSLLVTGMQWQRNLNASLSDLLFDAQTEPLKAGLSLMSLSFFYGVLHSLGPGHGKIVVSTYIATHPSKVKTSLWITVLSALVQAVVAIALVSVLKFVFNSSMREVSAHADTFITLSFYAVIALGAGLLLRSVRMLWHARQRQNCEHTHHHHSAHSHDHHQCCNHAPSAERVNQSNSYKETLSIIASIGIRPCTGAIMVLLFALMVDMYWMGMLSALMMAVGTAITTSTLAMMTITGKKLIRVYYQKNTDSQANAQHPAKAMLEQWLSPVLQIIGGAALILLGTVMLQSQLPGMSSVL
ncbi:hypothetical protein C9I91_09210 [Photobacterium jeanii]|nr:hypothetical protein C9I91_09210 [Photobacterium jeanii]